MLDLQQKVHVCAKLMSERAKKGNFHQMFHTNRSDDPYQFLWLLNEEVLIF
jgi:hypothetical protein